MPTPDRSLCLRCPTDHNSPGPNGFTEAPGATTSIWEDLAGHLMEPPHTSPSHHCHLRIATSASSSHTSNLSPARPHSSPYLTSSQALFPGSLPYTTHPPHGPRSDSPTTHPFPSPRTGSCLWSHALTCLLLVLSVNSKSPLSSYHLQQTPGG